MKQTAVEFFAKGLENLQYNPLEKNGYENAKQRLFEQAKKIEKDYMSQSMLHGWREALDEEVHSIDPNDFYNKTFK